MSPYQHGEVYVTDDGAETDLDLGHYERFTSMVASRNSNLDDRAKDHPRFQGPSRCIYRSVDARSTPL